MLLMISLLLIAAEEVIAGQLRNLKKLLLVRLHCLRLINGEQLLHSG